MFCPVCKYEFRRGFTHCNTCDVDLVETLPAEEEVDHSLLTPSGEMDQPMLLWRGANGGIFSALTVALDDAHIKFNREELDARLVFSSQHSDLEVWVPAADLPAAQSVLDAVLANPVNSEVAQNHSTATAPLGDDNDSDFGNAPLQDEDDEGAGGIRNENVARELYPEDATAQVWSGGDETMADVLKSCLAEIGIACYVHRPDSEAELESESEPREIDAAFAVFVLPEDEKRAREIVREVTDGIPPE